MVNQALNRRFHPIGSTIAHWRRFSRRPANVVNEVLLSMLNKAKIAIRRANEIRLGNAEE
jgi:hypothetical protein